MKLNADDVFVDYSLAGKLLDIKLFPPWLAKASEQASMDLKSIGFLFLDCTLGEYVVETKLGPIEFAECL